MSINFDSNLNTRRTSMVSRKQLRHTTYSKINKRKTISLPGDPFLHRETTLPTPNPFPLAAPTVSTGVSSSSIKEFLPQPLTTPTITLKRTEANTVEFPLFDAQRKNSGKVKNEEMPFFKTSNTHLKSELTRRNAVKKNNRDEDTHSMDSMHLLLVEDELD